MTAPVDPTVLRRKIAAHARAPAARPDPGRHAVRALGRALRHAATPFEGLGLMPGTITVEAGQDLDAAIAALPDHGLVAALEEASSRGLLGLAPGLVDALVEVQTTGRVEATELPPRQVTRIDEALARDFIDLVLAAFARETAAIEARDWPDRLSYGSRVRDRGQVSLLLPEGSYTILSADLGFDGVERRTRLVLVLPSNPALARSVAPDQPRPVDPRWIAARARMIDALRLPLEVVLMRVTQPLFEVQRLAEGDLLPFGVADLQEVSLETAEGRVLAHGRLGQLGGRRALRLPPRHVAPTTPAPGAPDGPEDRSDPAAPRPEAPAALPTTDIAAR
jgi:flagellar motor switch protein FliM